MPGYVNPIGPGLTTGRIDEGVDFAGAGPLFAIGDGQVLSVYDAGWPGGVYILLHLTGAGQLQGRYVYYAENIAPAVGVGERVRVGQLIGRARGFYPFIEIGWGTSVPGLAAAHGHYTEGVPTPEGRSFMALLESLRGSGTVLTVATVAVTKEPALSAGLAATVKAMNGLEGLDLGPAAKRIQAWATAAGRLY